MRRLVAPAVFLAAWALADVGFTLASGHEGLLAPFGPVHVASLGWGGLALGLRLVGTFLALPWLAWHLTRPHLGRWSPPP